MRRRITLCITGKVQGVNFRHLVRLRCLQHSIGGWIKNEPDGRVCLEAEGERLELQKLYDWIMTSPGESQVQDAVLRWIDPTFKDEPFIIIP